MEREKTVSKQRLQLNIVNIVFVSITIIVSIIFCLMSYFEQTMIIILLTIIALAWISLIVYLILKHKYKHSDSDGIF